MAKIPPKPRKMKGATREELMKLDKEELVERIIQLEAHTAQLKNIISKSLTTSSQGGKNEKNKPFDYTKCHYRRILLRIIYFGWDYQGLAVQEDTTETIEHHLFHALTRTCLIQSRDTANYHRCGRTDKGVSAFGQVISITIRSKHPPSMQNKPESLSTEIPYCKLLNRLLPKEIRAVAWIPIPLDKVDYSARFDCTLRRYKYYFPRSNLDITAMKTACSHLIGSHDFRHLCKMDVGNGVTEFRRKIFSADIFAVDRHDFEKPTSMYYLQIEGNAFLWHQIRCIMGLLILIGQRNESHNVIRELLDVENNPRKPQYNMALDIPLNLFHCNYELNSNSNSWVLDREELQCIIRHVQGEWTLQSVKSTMIKDCLANLEEQYSKLSGNERGVTQSNGSERDESSFNSNVDCQLQGGNEREDVQNNGSERDESNFNARVDCQLEGKNERGDTQNNGSERDESIIMAHVECLLQGVKPKVYTPLMKRETCSSLDERIEHYKKKRKI